MMRFLVSKSSLVLVLAVSYMALGQEEHTDRASDLIEQGVSLRLEGDEAGALALFQQAHELSPSPRTLAQMGLAEKSMRRYVDAERHLLAALAAEEDAWIAQHRNAIRKAADLVEKQLAWLTVETTTPDADLWINGADMGSLPLSSPLRVVAGEITIEVRAPGHLAKTTTRTLPAGIQTSLRIELEPQEVQETQGPEPPAEMLPPPASPLVSDQGETTSLAPWIITSAAVGTVGLGFGIGFAARTLDLKDQRDAVCPSATCNTQAGVDLDREARTSATLSGIGFVVAGLGAASAVTLWLLEPDDSPNALSVSATPDGAFFRASILF